MHRGIYFRVFAGLSKMQGNLNQLAQVVEIYADSKKNEPLSPWSSYVTLRNRKTKWNKNLEDEENSYLGFCFELRQSAHINEKERLNQSSGEGKTCTVVVVLLDVFWQFECLLLMSF